MPDSPLPDLPLPDRDRFLAFAFAAAELLVETGPSGRIAWAGGAFASRLGAPGEAFLGKAVDCLVAPADRIALSHALARAAAQGRLEPTVIRLADAAATPCALGALVLPGAAGRMCLTFSALPRAEPPAFSVRDGTGLRVEAEAALRAGQKANLGLLDLSGFASASAALPEADRASLSQEIAAVLAALGGPGAVATEVARGRFGVLGPGEPDLPRLAAAIETVLKLAPRMEGVGVRGRSLALPGPAEVDDPAGGRAARALRYALASFSRDGLGGLDQAGFGGGLTGFLATADARARALGARIAAHRFRLAFQPVVALADRRTHHYEALLRPLPDPDGPALSTQDFVTLAEAVGLSESLDLAIVAEVNATLAQTRDVRVAANISGLSMQSAGFRERLVASVPADGRLLVELTETADITDTEAAAATLAGLRAAGVEVAIDDFGAGSAAFRYLRDFRVDHVKIDGSYVRAATSGKRERELVASMRDLAHGLGAGVIAEMIETEETAALMAELGVTYGQGYLFGRAGYLPGARRV